MALVEHVLTQLLALGVFSGVVWAAGRPLARRLGAVPAGLTAALGLAAVAQILQLVGLAGGLRLWVLVPLAGALVLLSRPWSLGPRRKLSPRLWIALAFSLPAFVLTLYPPLGFDQTLYHLPFTQAFARTGGLPFLPDLRFPVFPQLAEILATPLLLAAGDSATQLAGLVALAGCAALVFQWTRELAPSASWLASAVLVGSPGALYLTTCGYVEPVLGLCGLGALYAAARGRSEGGLGWVIAAGFLAGSAASVKYSGLLFLPAAAWLLAPARFRAADFKVSGAAFGGAALLALAPTYGRIVAHTGNPLFPFFGELFGSSPWAADEFLGPRGSERLAKAATLLWDLTFDRAAAGGFPPFSPALALAVPLLLVVAWRRPDLRRLAAVAVGFVAISPTHGHYFLAIAPLWALLLAVGIAEFGVRRHGIAVVALGLALAGPAWVVYRVGRLGPPPATGEQREAFLGRHLHVYPALRFVNRQAPGEPVYALGAENLVAFAEGPLLGDANGPRSFTRLGRRAAELGSLAAALDDWQLRYLLVNHELTSWLRQAEADPGLEAIYQDAFTTVYRVLLLDRHAHEIAPLGPAAVVVPHPRVPKQVGEHEPSVARALADAAVDDDVVRGPQAAFLFVDRPQSIGRVESAVFRIDGARPGHVLGAGDVTAAQGALVGVVVHVQPFAGELEGTADVDQRAPVSHVREDFVPEGAQAVVVARRRLVGDRLALRYRAVEGPPLLEPLEPPAVHDARPGVTEELEHPERVSGPPVVLVAVEHHRRLAADAEPAEQRLEARVVEIVAANGVVQVLGPVDFDRARDVSRRIQQWILVRFHDDEIRVSEVFGDPLGRDENFGLGVAALGDGTGHGSS